METTSQRVIQTKRITETALLKIKGWDINLTYEGQGGQYFSTFTANGVKNEPLEGEQQSAGMTTYLLTFNKTPNRCDYSFVNMEADEDIIDAIRAEIRSIQSKIINY